MEHSQVSRFPYFGSVFLFGVVFVLLQSVFFRKQMLVLSVNSSVLWNIVLISAWVCVIPCAPLFFSLWSPLLKVILCVSVLCILIFFLMFVGI